MRAVVIREFGGQAVLKEEEIPLPIPKKGEVRIRIAAAALNPVDIKMREGVYPLKLPVVLGADCSGSIDKLGDSVHQFGVGDEVAALVFGQGSNGTYAEYVCVPAAFVAKKPKNVPIEAAAALPLVGLTAYRAIMGSGAVHKGDALFIAGGTGGLGSLGIALARVVGAGPIFTTAGSEESFEFLHEQFSIDRKQVLFYKGMDLEEMAKKLVEMNQGEHFPAVFDFVGGKMKELCFKLAEIGGHLVTTLPESEDFPIRIWTRQSPVFDRALSLHFIFVGAQSFHGSPKSWSSYQKQLEYLFALVENGKLKIPPPELIGSFSEETIRKGHEKLSTGHTRGKLVVRF